MSTDLTPEERAHEAAGDWIMGPVDMGELERLIAAAIRAAVAAEREACAQIVKTMADDTRRRFEGSTPPVDAWALDEAADAIRARSEGGA